MKFILYCIMRNSAIPPKNIQDGVGGTPVSYISCNRLSAAVSEILQQDLAPDVPRLVAYGKVIAALHREATVIPMRYGSVLENESRGRQLLEKNYAGYSALLEELEGCVEMGIRIIPEAAEARRQMPAQQYRQPQPAPGAAPQSGRSWLAERKNHYAAGEQIEEASRAILARCCHAFNGLYRKYSVDPLPAAGFRHDGPSILSLYFLVPQGHIEKFCVEFREMSSRETAKLLLSGPWAPYNFAATVEPPDQPPVLS